jgi:hypothetical protein
MRLEMTGKIGFFYVIRAFPAVLAVFLLVGLLVYSGVTSASDAYDYPIKPGTDEWKAFGSHEEMLKACQIPEELLHRISTTALVETVLNYPLGGDWWAYDTPEIGIKRVREQFNGLSELLSRNDGGVSLIALYQTMDPTTIDINSPIAEQAEYYFRILNIELLLSQDSVISNLSITDLQNLISRARIISELKLLRPDLFSGFSQEFTSTIIEKAEQAILLKRYRNDYDVYSG